MGYRHEPGVVRSVCDNRPDFYALLERALHEGFVAVAGLVFEPHHGTTTRIWPLQLHANEPAEHWAQTLFAVGQVAATLIRGRGQDYGNVQYPTGPGYEEFGRGLRLEAT